MPTRPEDPVQLTEQDLDALAKIGSPKKEPNAKTLDTEKIAKNKKTLSPKDREAIKAMMKKKP